MRVLATLVLVCAPAAVRADMFPYVTKGPVITGVTQTEAWVAWETAHHQGTGTTCTADSLTGSPNTQVPELRLVPAVPAGDRFQDPDCSRDHKVHITGMLPGTRYGITLDMPWDNNGGTAHGSFHTAPASPEASFSFVVYGDTRDGSALESSTRADHQAVTSAILGETDAVMLVNTGDLALNLPVVSGDDRGYTEFFDIERDLLATHPVFPIVGNHETIDTTDFDLLMSAPGFDGAPHPYYWSTQWGGVHFAFLDSFEGAPTTLGFGGNAPAVTDAQAAWLDGDLAQARAAGFLSFIVLHQGPFSHSNDSNAHGGLADVVQKVLPLMLRYGVLATFAGHDHYYQRGHEGCIDYFVIGGGGAPMYDPDPTAQGVAVAVKAPSYAVVQVDGSRATLVAKQADGTVLDSFTFQEPDGTACGVPPLGGPDGGSPDAGPAPDAGAPWADAGPGIDAGGTAPPADAGAGAQTAAPEGCGCAAGSLAPLLALAVLAGLMMRRRRGGGPG